jgi:GNAT superfamily N-acetyltransferase
VRADLARGGGALARVGQHIVGCLRFEQEPAYLQVRRVAVDPGWQRQGIGKALMSWAHDLARQAGVNEVRVGVRPALGGNLRFYEGLGYRVIAEHRHPGYREITWVEMAVAV